MCIWHIGHIAFRVHINCVVNALQEYTSKSLVLFARHTKDDDDDHDGDCDGDDVVVVVIVLPVVISVMCRTQTVDHRRLCKG